MNENLKRASAAYEASRLAHKTAKEIIAAEVPIGTVVEFRGNRSNAKGEVINYVSHNSGVLVRVTEEGSTYSWQMIPSMPGHAIAEWGDIYKLELPHGK